MSHPPSPEQSQGTLARAVGLHRAGRLLDAEAMYRTVIAAQPDHHRALFALSLIALETQRDELACEWLVHAVALEPTNVVYLSNLSEAHRRCGRLGEAARALVQALSISPTFAEGHYNLGVVLRQAGEIDRALLHLERAIDLKPEVVDFHRGLADALAERGNEGRATGHRACAQLLEGAGGSPPASVLADLSAALEGLGRIDGAATASLRAIELDPACASAHATLGAARVVQGRYDEAAACCRRALTIDPSAWLAHFHLGNALAGNGRVSEAIHAYRRTVELRPEQHAAHSALVFLMPYAPEYDVATIGREARAWARLRADPLSAEVRPHTNEPGPERRLRVAYVSPDLRDHPVARFLLPLLANHDRHTVEVTCYSSVPAADAVTSRLQGVSDRWRDVGRLDDATVAEMVREDGVDVLVDLTMHASGGRPLLFARRPAPVQICWLAYVGTTGLRTMDHRFTDPHLEPPGVDPAWSAETPMVLPDSVWCYEPCLEPAPPVAPLPALARGHVTFGSQQSIQKVHQGVLGLWARVLGAVDGSRLRMFAPPGARQAIVAALEREGFGGERVEFVALRSRAEYMADYASMDICLDTFPCNGATSSMDAFWMGVPVVSLVGMTPPGRAGLSIATNLALPHLAARTEAEYVEVAVTLARDLEGLGRLRRELRPRMQGSPLMDARRFARNVEQAYRSAWRKWCNR
jgi:predicted O-linked N-acetylglucosamine transferase (SPINDLY family)